MSTVTKKLAFAALVFALAGTLNAAAEFIHTPVLSGPAGEDLDIQAALMGAENVSNVQVRLYFRQRGVELYSSVVMGGPSSSLDASIPGAQVGTAGVEYYIEADSFSGAGKTVLATYPASNPEVNPVEVVVRRDLSAPAVTPLSPADGESVDSSMPVISASFDDPAGALNLTSVVVKMDGRAVSSDGLEVYDTIVTYIPPASLADGTHKVTVTVTNKAGHTGSATWSFVVGASASQNIAQIRQPWVVDGSLTLETQYGDVLLQPSLQTTGLPFRPYGANQGTLAVNARGPDDTLSLKVYDTDMNRSDQQPLDRYNLTWTNRDGYLAVGDVSPSFSELSLFDLYELRGFDFNLLSGPADGMHTRFEGVWGQTESGVNGGAGDLTNTLSSPTYAQYLYGWRWEVGSPFFKWGFNGVTINDDVNSISNPEGIEPEYNTMFTSDISIGVPFAWLTLNGEAGVDYFAADQTLTGISAGSAYKAGAVWDALPLGSKLTFEWRDLGGGWGLLPGGYSTMANPGLQADYRGFESTFSQSLMNGALGLNLAENNWHDNLQDSDLKPVTTTNYFSGNTSITPAQWLPYLNLGYSQTNVYNNGSATLLDGEGNTQTQFINQLTAVYNGALGYTHTVGSTGTGSLNLSYVDTDLTDMSPFRSMQDISSWNTILAAFYGRGFSSFNATVGVGGGTDPAAFEPADGYLLPTDNSRDISAGARWSQQWMESPFSSYLGWDLVQTNSDTDSGTTQAGGTPLGMLITDSTRNTFSLGGAYKVDQFQKVGLQLSYAVVNATQNLGFTDYGYGDNGVVYDSLAELYVDLRYDLTF